MLEKRSPQLNASPPSLLKREQDKPYISIVYNNRQKNIIIWQTPPCKYIM